MTSRELATSVRPAELTEEDFWRQRLMDLQRAYHREAEPIIKRLVAIEALKPLPPIYISLEQWERTRD